MSRYKTVKEVCALTGLSGKHLYYFHHEKVVQATAFSNYSVEDHDGYKLYDDEAVEKLQQIALFYQLGLKRNEIKDIMQKPDYNGSNAIETMLQLVHSQKSKAERHIAALEYLKGNGVNHGFSEILGDASLEDLGKTVILLGSGCKNTQTENRQAEQFKTELGSLLDEFQSFSESEISSDDGTVLIKNLFELAQRFWGVSGYPLIFAMFIGISSEKNPVCSKITAAQGNAAVKNITGRAKLYKSVCASQDGHENNKGEIIK